MATEKKIALVTGGNKGIGLDASRYSFLSARALSASDKSRCTR